MKAYDFFCGIGGLTRGLHDAGIEVLAGIDLDERCRLTYEKNNPGTRFIHKDVGSIDLDDLNLSGPLPEGNDILFAGCAPCQPFSHHRKSFGNRLEATLLGKFNRLVRMALPGYVLVENVPGIAKIQGFSTFLRFRKMLNELGYHHDCRVLDAKYYGVPQNRRRLVLLAARNGRISFPKKNFGTRSRPVKTVRQAIAHYPEIAAGERYPEIPNHVAANITELNMRRLRATPTNGGDRRSWPKDIRLSCHNGDHAGHTDVYGRMFWDRPAPALTGRCISISNGRYGHPEQDRAISLREAAALQTFPDRYEFFGHATNISRQIGNAVPVRLAEKIGKHLLYLSETS